jgi:hypothetical protein
MGVGIDITVMSWSPQRMTDALELWRTPAAPPSSITVASSGWRVRSAAASATMSGVAGVSSKTKARNDLLIATSEVSRRE